ncbi:hypothetical protein [Hyphomicrobium sp.]|uniref:hypothetical protein n=1 Tax=Hyphomicrobium sp. TaxID=82 RepID=UPI002D78F923|nr:hypothetical protein [Hyphomicrobium sp.]HET6390369.1 hypothetical protein [Hyphomicrobium sp.]
MKLKYAAAVTGLMVFAGSPVLAAENNAAGTQNTSPSAQGAPTSGPGIAGAPGNKNGPAAKEPSNNSGSSTGTAGSTSDKLKMNDTQPTQDSQGVSGEQGNKNGPAAQPNQ